MRQLANIQIDKVIDGIRQGKSIIAIAKDFQVNRNTVTSHLKKYGITKSSIKFNHNFFSNIDSEIKAYWLGFLMADGCVSETHHAKVVIKLNRKDKDHLQKFNNAINSCIKLNYGKSQSTVTSQHYSLQMCNDLKQLGCTPRKSLTLKFPNIHKKFLSHFIRGYFDGDGSINIKKYKTNQKPQFRLNFIGTKKFLTKIQFILDVKTKLGRSGKAYNFEVAGNKQCQRIIDWIYNDSTVYLDRKREIAFQSTILTV